MQLQRSCCLEAASNHRKRQDIHLVIHCENIQDLGSEKEEAAGKEASIRGRCGHKG
jgi:hypothetical protein